MEPFATLEELQARLDWTLTEDEQRDAVDALEHLSELARFYGRNWVDASAAPRLVKTTVLAAAKRYLRNPDGYTTSRAGDETVGWTDRGSDEAGSAHFTPSEIKALASMGGRGGIISAPVIAWGSGAGRRREGLVPVDGWPNEKPFPLFASDTSPW